MKRAVITGATGAIGTALIESLLQDNVEILVLVRKNSKRIDVLPKNKLVTIKYCGLDEMKDFNAFDTQPYDVFYHFAWEGTTGEARNDMYMQTKNIEYTMDAIQLAHRLGCKTFVGAGSQAEYGRVEGIITPNTPAYPENGYGISKLSAGLMSKIYCKKLGLKSVWVRIVSVYGPNDNPVSMVPSALLKMKKNEPVQFTKAEQKWDYLFSKDAGRAFKLVGDKGIDGKTYVLGSGTTAPLLDFIMLMRDATHTNSKLEIGAIPYSPKQVMNLCADITELEKDVGWKPEYEFKDGIQITADSISLN